MMTCNIRAKNMKKCAFCKFWYDPTSSAIRPKYPAAGVWEYDEGAQKKCLLTNGAMKANLWCKRYECKL